MNKKNYFAAGILPVIKIGNKEYLVLVKRTKDALSSPGSHSLFGGEADEGENLDPDSIAQRESLEEIFIFNKRREESYNLIFEDNNYNKEYEEKTTNLIKLWNEKMNLEGKELTIPEKPIVQINPYFRKDEEFNIPSLGKIKIIILKFEIKETSIKDLIIFDGEGSEENDQEKILDRQIDLFEINQFKEWWLNKKENILNSNFTFQEGRENQKETFISKEKDKISPGLIYVLDKWLL